MIIHSTEDARRLAEKSAKNLLEPILSGKEDDLLDELYLKTEKCWLFYRSRKINLPSDSNLLGFAFMVDIYGNINYVYDFYDDLDKAKAYIDHFSKSVS